jgi:maltooligosyltrehalose synthase
LFTRGKYQAVAATGAKAENVFAFSRRLEGHSVLAVAPRLVASLITTPDEAPLGADVWQDGVLVLPGVPSGRRWQNIFTGEYVDAVEREGQTILPLAKVFANFPVALLLSTANQ